MGPPCFQKLRQPHRAVCVASSSGLSLLVTTVVRRKYNLCSSSRCQCHFGPPGGTHDGAPLASSTVSGTNMCSLGRAVPRRRSPLPFCMMDRCTTQQLQAGLLHEQKFRERKVQLRGACPWPFACGQWLWILMAFHFVDCPVCPVNVGRLCHLCGLNLGCWMTCAFSCLHNLTISHRKRRCCLSWLQTSRESLYLCIDTRIQLPWTVFSSSAL